jgi:hypothetical protein
MSDSDDHPQITKNTVTTEPQNRQDIRNGTPNQGINIFENTSSDKSSDNSTKQHDDRNYILAQDYA